MNVNTINNDRTMSGASATLLAGRYRIVRQLGQGGMGSVWLAEDTKLDNHLVAVKMLPSILVSNKRAYQQVKQEALVSLKLTHSNIAAVRAFEEENGSPFLVMDYIDGLSLDDYLAEKGKLTEEETIQLLKPVAAALDYAHKQGVVHRDVKPGNVMIRKDGTPFVLDFGIAREIQETMTRVTGKLSSGTLLYMSPEQLNGDAPKSAQDVYSFAAMVYECLKGEPPFSRGGVEDQIKHKTPEPLQGNIAICPSVMSGLAKSPDNRPVSCAAVLEGSEARKTSIAVKPTAPARKAKSRGVVIATALLALVALVTASGVWLFWKVQRDAELKRQWEMEIARLLEQEHRVAEEKRQRDENIRKEEMKRVALANAEKRIADEEAERKARVEKAKERIAEEKRKAEESRIATEAVARTAKTENLKVEAGEARDSELKLGDTKTITLPDGAEKKVETVQGGVSSLRTQPSLPSGHQDYGIDHAVKSAWAQPLSFTERHHYRYEACLVPYVMENGQKKYVDVDAKCGEPSIAVCSYQNADHIVVVAGSNARQPGLVLVNLKTKDGTRSGRKWLNSEDFSSNLSSREVEVELR